MTFLAVMSKCVAWIVAQFLEVTERMTFLAVMS